MSIEFIHPPAICSHQHFASLSLSLFLSDTHTPFHGQKRIHDDVNVETQQHLGRRYNHTITKLSAHQEISPYFIMPNQILRSLFGLRDKRETRRMSRRKRERERGRGGEREKEEAEENLRISSEGERSHTSSKASSQSWTSVSSLAAAKYHGFPSFERMNPYSRSEQWSKKAR
jgi:hypothetical protein